MEGFCRSCLVKFDEPTDLVPYSEKNRRLFVYATGLQAKRNDTFIFQLCKECFLNMKVACNFKKTCRNSDKKFKNYLANKEAGDAIDFCTFLKNNDESLKFRLPMYAGNSTPANRNKDDDNESTCTSIQNFMTDILKSEEIPDSEARIIKEVIEEETDILDDSLDSHWLQDDMSIDTDFRLDFSFSPFSTPRSTIDDPYTPKKVQNNTTTLQEQNVPVKKEFDDQTYMENINPNIQNDSHKIKKENVEDLESCDVDTNLENVLNNSANKGSLYNLFPTPPIIPNISAPPTPLIKSILFGDNIDTQSRPNHVYVPTELNSNITSEKRIEEKDKSGEKCVIDLNLENALKNDSAKKVMLDDLLATPPVIPNISAPPTPLIKNILFGDKIDIENRPKNVYVPRPDENDIDGLYEEFCKISDQDLIIKEEFYIKEENSDHEYIIKKAVNVNKPVKTTETLNESNEDKYCLKEFLCKICDRKFKHVMALKVHCVSAHKFKIASAKRKSVRKKMICDYCGKVFMSSRCIVRHIQKHMEPDKYDCDRCPLSFRTVTGLKAHQSTHGIVHKGSNNKKRNYICTVCGAVQNSSSNHNIHMRRHNNTYTITCTVCGKGFYRTSDLDVHMRRHTGERPFECRYCPSRFARQDALNRHIKCHTGEKPFHCTFCDCKFITAALLKRHHAKCKECLEQQKTVIQENEELSNMDVTVFYAEVTDSSEVAKNGPIIVEYYDDETGPSSVDNLLS